MDGEQKQTRWFFGLWIAAVFVITFTFGLYVGFSLGLRFERNGGGQQPTSFVESKNQRLVITDGAAKNIFPEIPYYPNLKWAKYHRQTNVLFVNSNKTGSNSAENILSFDMSGDLAKSSIHLPEPKPLQDYLSVGEVLLKYYRDKLKSLGYTEEVSLGGSGKKTVQYNLHRDGLIQSISIVVYLNQEENCDGSINSVATACGVVSGEDFELFVSDPYKLEQKQN